MQPAPPCCPSPPTTWPCRAVGHAPTNCPPSTATLFGALVAANAAAARPIDDNFSVTISGAFGNLTYTPVNAFNAVFRASPPRATRLDRTSR